MILTLIITILFCGFLLYKNVLIENRLLILEKGLPIPKDTIVGKIPEQLTISDVDDDYSVIRDVLESIRLEDWVFDIKQERSILSASTYDIEFINPQGNTKVKTRFYIHESNDRNKHQTADIGFFLILTDEHKLAYDKEPIRNEIILFIWEYIVNYHKDLNQERKKSYIESIKHIKSNLTTLNRVRKLDQII